jgi:hypothetical protein
LKQSKKGQLTSIHLTKELGEEGNPEHHAIWKLWEKIRAKESLTEFIPCEKIVDNVKPDFEPFVLDCRTEQQKKQLELKGGKTFKPDFDVWEEKPINISVTKHQPNFKSNPFLIDHDDKIAIFSIMPKNEDDPKVFMLQCQFYSSTLPHKCVSTIKCIPMG